MLTKVLPLISIHILHFSTVSWCILLIVTLGNYSNTKAVFTKEFYDKNAKARKKKKKFAKLSPSVKSGLFYGIGSFSFVQLDGNDSDIEEMEHDSQKVTNDVSLRCSLILNK